MAEDPTLDAMDTFIANIKRPFKQRGFGVSAEEESQMPLRQSLFQEGETKERGPMLGRLLFGLNMTETDSIEGQYLSSLGFRDYKLGSRSKIPSVRNFENKMLRASLPSVVEIARELEEIYKEEYQDESATVKETETLKGYVADKVKVDISNIINDLKQELKESSYAESNNPLYLSSQQSFRALNKNQQKRAMTLFKSQMNRLPKVSPTDQGIEDLQILIELGKTI